MGYFATCWQKYFNVVLLSSIFIVQGNEMLIYKIWDQY